MPDAELQGIGCPTLVFIGDRERIYDPEKATARARRLISGAEVELLPQLGHLPGMQRPDLVNPRIVSFLK
jgi:pimeloyl-ACP methyl ester carboxylesterase